MKNNLNQLVRPIRSHLLYALALLLTSTVAGSLVSQEVPAQDNPHPVRAVFMIGEMEYNTSSTLPEFARKSLIPQGIDCTFVHVNDNDPNDFPGLNGALEPADVLILSVRRRTPPTHQMEAIRNFIARGGGVVGIRTASHAFGREPASDNHQSWDEFDRHVFAMDYEGHYGNKPPEDPPSEIQISPFWKHHPILANLKSDSFTSSSHLYKNRRPGDGVSILLTGSIKNKTPAILEPVAWTSPSCPGRVFYTSLGNPDDFLNPDFTQLLVNAVIWAAEGAP